MGNAAGVETVVEGLDVLADCDLDALSDAGLDALLFDLQHLGHRLEALTCRVADRWAQRGVVVGRFEVGRCPVGLRRSSLPR